MAEIRIGTKYRLVSDEYCWSAQLFRGIRKSGPDSGKEIWEAFAYHLDLGKAARSLMERQLRASDASDVVELRNEWERISAEMDGIMQQFADLTATGESAT